MALRELLDTIFYRQSPTLHFPVQWIKRSAQNEIIRGESPGHRIAEHCKISGPLREAFMNAVEHVSPHHPQPATASLGKSFESFRRRSDPIRIHRENLKRAVLPLDNAVQRRPRCFGNVKKN